MVLRGAGYRVALLNESANIGSVANNLFNLKKVEYPIIAKTRFVVFTEFFEFLGE
jgi:hypothetical protein